MRWYESQPALVEDVKAGIGESNQELVLSLVGDKYVLTGNWDVIAQGNVLESYKIRIVFPDDFPKSVPLVFEIEEKIPRSRDRHMSESLNWAACLFVSCARWEIWPVGAPFGQFLNGPVRQFFLAQTYYEEFKKWPWVDYRHETEGQLQYFEEKLGTTKLDHILEFIEIVLKEKTPRSTKCFCNSGRKAFECHDKLIGCIRENVSLSDILAVKKLVIEKQIASLSSRGKVTKKMRRPHPFRKFF